MTAIESLDQLPSGTWLRDNPVAAHLGSDEVVELVLTNREVGLRREADGAETRIPPADDCGALAILTDRRVLFLVGDPADRQGDFVDSVAYERVAEAVAETETLTQQVLIETDADEYAFTARETDAVDEVQSFLETAASVYADCDAHLTGVERARERLDAAIEAHDWETCDETINDARVALGEARARLKGTPFDPLRDRVENLGDAVDGLARVRHRRHAEVLADECEDLLDEHEYETSHERLRAARDHLERAESLGADLAAAADGGTDAAVATTHDRLESLASTVTARPLDDAESYRRTARAAEDCAERIDALESTFECYRSAATLMADAGSPFEGDETAAREDAERVIGDLVEAHLDAARDDLAAGEWERDADNPTSAYELLSDAADHAERALELARAYPPGDVATIEGVLEDVESLLDPLRIEVELSEADGNEA